LSSEDYSHGIWTWE